MPSSNKAKKVLLTILPEEFKGTVYELGSGWGSVILPLAKRYPNLAIKGFETSLIPYLVSQVRLYFVHHPKAVIERRDFLHIHLGEADLIVCYLYPGAMRQLKEKFHRELKPGTFIVSNTFAIPGWTPLKVAQVDDLYASKIYLYRVA